MRDKDKAANSPRIVFIASGHHPFSSRLYYKELLTLSKRYDNLAIIAPHNKNEEVSDDIRIIGIKKYTSRYNRFSSLAELYKKAIACKPDVVHCHEPDSLYVAIKIKKKLPGVKVIYDCHEFHPQGFTESFPWIFQKPASFLIDALENRLAAKADAIITVNEMLGDRFKKIHSRVCILPNYPRLSFLSNSRDKNVFSDAVVRLCYIGGLSEDRGLFRMLELVKKLNVYFETMLVLAGKFASKAVEHKFQEWIENNDAEKIVQYKGFLPHQDAVEELLQADVGLILLGGRERYEWTEPIKYFEYSATGLPIVLSNLSAQQQLIEENKNGILVDFDKPELAVKAVQWLKNNPDRAEEMSAQGRKAFLEKYNWEKLENRIFQLYEDLCSNKKCIS